MSIALTNDSAIVVWEPFGNPGDNNMIELDAPYTMFADLAQHDLILYDFGSHANLSVLVENKIPFDLAGKLVWLCKKEDDKIRNMANVRGVFLTKVGLELRSILSLQWNQAYVGKLKEWFNKNGVDLVLSVRREGGKLRGVRL